MASSPLQAASWSELPLPRLTVVRSWQPDWPVWPPAPSPWRWASVSVSSQNDSERALLEKERRERAETPQAELQALVAI